LLAEAVEAARGAAAVLLFLGLPAAEETEGLDRTHLDLPADQLRVLEAVTAVNPRVAVVLANGGVVTTGWGDRVAAVLECWLGGQAGGAAVADVVLGRVDPGGRLAETIPLRLEDTPAYLNWPGEEGHVRYGEGIFVGYRYYDAVDREVAFPFGHGLSYTTFGYSGLAVEPAPDGGLTVTVTVTNTGGVAGREVVQVYLGDLEASVARPVRELAGFATVALAAGEARRVVVPVERRRLAFWSVRATAWIVEDGAFEVAVGASSRDLRLRSRVEVPGDGVRLPLTGDSTLAEWLADPVGGPRLRAVLGVAAGQALPGLLGEPELWVMLRALPLKKLLGFPLGGDGAALEGLLRGV
jgi:beta-glucosidase